MIALGAMIGRFFRVVVPMANIDNLRSFAVLSTSELREIQSRGGKNSGSARRQRKELRQLTTDLMLSDAVPAYRDVVRL